MQTALEIRKIRRAPGEDIYRWTPFEQSEEFTGDWWDAPPYAIEDPFYVQALLGGVEVGRAEIDERFGDYSGAPPLGLAALEIQLIEVAHSHRRRGIGRDFVSRLAANYPDRRLVALSEADEFWDSLGWNRYDHPDGPLHHQVLFLQPG